jgi:hypothetical protein
MQKFTIRPVILKHKINEKGMASIKIAVTVDRKVTYINTSHRVHKDQWDDENKAVYRHENAKLINVSIRRKIAEIERDLINNSIQGVQLSKRIIKGQKKAGIKGIKKSFRDEDIVKMSSKTRALVLKKSRKHKADAGKTQVYRLGWSKGRRTTSPSVARYRREKKKLRRG